MWIHIRWPSFCPKTLIHTLICSLLIIEKKKIKPSTLVLIREKGKSHVQELTASSQANGMLWGIPSHHVPPSPLSFTDYWQALG